MPTAEEWVAYFYPFLLDETDPRHVSASELDMALAVAADWRPACLSEDRQNQAQAHLACYVVQYRAQVAASGIGTGAPAEVPIAGPVVERSEGDVTVRYATSGTGIAPATATIRANLTGPNTPYASWEKLHLLCGGASDVGTPGVLPVRRGAIITSAG